MAIVRGRLVILPALLAASCATGRTAPRPADRSVVATYSIVAHDPASGELGIAVQSRFLAVGGVVPWARAGVGAIATQAWANVGYGPRGLDLMRRGRPPVAALQRLLDGDERVNARQVALVDALGRTAAHTGRNCGPWSGHRSGKGYCVQGNVLAGKRVLDAMAQAFERARSRPRSDLAASLMAALQAAQAAGGDKRGMQSAALLVVRRGAGFGTDNDRFIDLRVDDHAQPIDELGRLLGMHRKKFAKAHDRR